MNFVLWHCLDTNKDYQMQKINIDWALGIGVSHRYESYVDDEGVYRVVIDVKDLDEILEIAYILEDNIVIYGTDNNIIMTVKTMNELGL